MAAGTNLRVVSTVEIPLERAVFLRTLLRELAGTLQDVVGLEEASGFISVVGQRMGSQINASYRQALVLPELDRRQVAEVLVDLKRRIRGDFTQGRLELRKERVDLDAVLQIAIETSLPLLQAKGHKLRLTYGAERIQVEADVTRLAQVFSNLLNNSAKYSPPGSEVSVTTRRHGDQITIARSPCCWKSKATRCARRTMEWRPSRSRNISARR
jgi:signal transduction histidine kinase